MYVARRLSSFRVTVGKYLVRRQSGAITSRGQKENPNTYIYIRVKVAISPCLCNFLKDMLGTLSTYIVPGRYGIYGYP